MKQWYCSNGGRDQSGPHTADEMRAQYSERRIDRDTLVWREGLPEWQPLARVAGELQLDTVVPDATRPPPLPPAAPALARDPRTAPQAKKAGMSGCLIAVLVAMAVAVPLVGILAAIAIPAYQDYTERARQAAQAQPGHDPARMQEADARVRRLLQHAMATYFPAQGQCPDTFEFESLQVRDSTLSGDYTVDIAGEGEGYCVYQVAFLHQGPDVDGKTLLYQAAHPRDGDTPDDIQISCSTSELASELRPSGCI